MNSMHLDAPRDVDVLDERMVWGGHLHPTNRSSHLEARCYVMAKLLLRLSIVWDAQFATACQEVSLAPETAGGGGAPKSAPP